MSSATLQCRVEPSSRLAFVRVHGHLSASTVATLRGAVLKCLTDEPALIVIDLSSVVAADDLALTIFPTLARAAAAWPGSSLVLSQAPPRLDRRLRKQASAHLYTVTDGTDDLLAIEAEATPPMLSEQLPPGPAAVTHARALVRRVCELGQVADEAELLVTELVSNAVLHGSPPVDLRVTRRRTHLHLAVRDRNPAEPRIGGVSDDAGGGRGLLVVDAVSTGWGCTPTADGKVVWATLRVIPLTIDR